ncbi:MAG: choice-of-anchor tandem repeat GloVer-containing protein, partial [Verrucomicrobiota bacterium]
KVSTAGVLTVLHNFACTTEGRGLIGPLVQGTDGNFYGYSTGGATNQQEIYKITASGAFTMLHSMTAAEGNASRNGLIQATDGNLYGTAVGGGTFNKGTIFKITTGGALTVLFNCDGSNNFGVNPTSNLTQHTNGLLYGDTLGGGDNNAGVFYSLDVGLGPFVSLVSTSGKEGAKIGIRGQGFSASSVVKFGGVQATSVTRQGSTFLNATVPAGALTGSVTVTTGATTLTSNRTFRVTPTLASFSPTSGSVGTPVMITGTGLLQTTKVTFNKVKATTVTINSDTQVTANVPTGATTGKIAITTAGGTATSRTVFTVN